VTAARSRLYYGWFIVALSFCVLLISAGIRSAPGVLIAPMERDMGWTTATISVAVAINIALFGLMGPFAAALMQKIGIRKTILLGLGIIVVSTVATSRITTPLALILTWGIGVGVGTGMIGLVVAATVAARWFVKRRGTVTGVLTAASATGQLVFLPVLAVVAQHLGWRAVGLVIAGAALLAAIPIVFFMRDYPRDLGLRPYGATADTDPRSCAAATRSARRSPRSAVRRRGATSGCCSARSSCAARAPTASSVRTSFRPAAITASRRFTRPDISR
jgi:sugar phosphate permease